MLLIRYCSTWDSTSWTSQSVVLYFGMTSVHALDHESGGESRDETNLQATHLLLFQLIVKDHLLLPLPRYPTLYDTHNIFTRASK